MFVSPLLLLLTAAATHSLTIEEDGGYTDLVIQLEDGVNTQNCTKTVSGLLSSLTSLSASLVSLSGGAAYLAGATVLLPHSWVGCGETGQHSGRVDIRVEQWAGQAVVERHTGRGWDSLPSTLLLPSSALDNTTALLTGWVDWRYGPLEPCDTVEEAVRGAWELAGVRQDGEQQRDSRPAVRVLRRPAPRLVIAVQTSPDMREEIRWVNKAVQAVVRYSLPATTAVAVTSFSNTTRLETAGLVSLHSEAGRGRVADSVPGQYQLRPPATPICRTCALQDILTTVLDNNTAGAHVVLVGRAGEGGSSQQEVEQWAGRGLRVSSVAVGAGPGQLDLLARLTGGRSELVPPSPHPVTVYHGLLAGLERVVGLGSTALHARPALNTENSTVGRFSLAATPTATPTTLFRVFVPDTEDHLIKRVSFTDTQTGAQFGPYTKMSASYDLINAKVPNMAGVLPFRGGREWEYRVDWYPSAAPSLAVIAVTSATPTTTPTVHSWAAGHAPPRPGSQCGDTQQLLVWARLDLAGQPLTGQEVRALVETSGSGPGAELELEEVLPGLYRGVAWDLPGPARYTATILAGGRAVPAGWAVSLGPPGHCRPPAPVSDLQAVATNTSRLGLAWSTVTSAQRYTVRYSLDSPCSLLGGTGAELTSLGAGQGAGQWVELETDPPQFDTVLYLAVFSTDEMGNVSPVSNIESVLVPTPPTAPPLPVTRASTVLQDWHSVIIVASSLGGVLMLCLLAVVYILVTYRRPAKQPVSPRPDSPPPHPDSEGVTSIEQILARERVACPVYWSCDQILRGEGGEGRVLGRGGAGGGAGGGPAYSEQTTASPASRASYSSGSYTESSQSRASEQDCGYRLFAPVHCPAPSREACPAPPPLPPHCPRPLSTTQRTTPECDEGYDSASRELELINGNKLYTIV